MNAKDRATKRATELKAAQTIIDGAKAGNREVTAAELKTLNAHFAEVDRLDAETKATADADALMAKMCSYGAPTDTDREARDQMAHVKEPLAAAVQSKSTFGFNLKAPISTPGLDLGGQGTGVSTAPPGATAVPLRDYLRLERVDVGVVRYYRIGAGSGATVVAEGAVKPELNSSIEPVDAPLQKLAVRFTVTDELAQDAGFLVQYVTAEASRAVLARENQTIVAALEAVTGALTSTGTKANAVDVIAGAIGAAEASNGLTPSGLILNPVDLAGIRTLKATGSGQYAVDPLTTAPATLHGVPLISTPAVGAGKAYLLTSGVGVFYAHNSGLRIEAGTTGDDFVRNQFTTRVEERVLPAIVQPSLLTKITLT